MPPKCDLSISFSIAGTAFGLVLSVFANYLTDNPSLFAIILVVGLLFLVIGAVSSVRQINEIEVAIRSPLAIRSTEEAARYARKGLIAFVPLFRPNDRSPARPLSPTEVHNAALALEYEKLCLEESNFKTILVAIETHKTALEHCWLLTTAGGEGQVGTAPYAKLIAHYCCESLGVTCEFHYGPSSTIALDDDPGILGKTYDVVKDVLHQASARPINLHGHELVVDITSGVRSMMLGMVFACLDKDRDIEFIGSHYDAGGRLTGKPFPIIFGFELMDKQ